MTSLDAYNLIGYRSFVSRRLAGKLATTGATILYECPSTLSAAIVSMWIVNTHSGNETIRVHHCRSGDSAGTSNALLYDLTINSKTTSVYDQPILMSPGDRIWFQASASDRIAVTIYGSEQ